MWLGRLFSKKKDVGEMNRLRAYREKISMSKTELARKAELSLPTIDRTDQGKACRIETKRLF